MQNGDVFSRLKRPTMKQIQYIEELEQADKKRGAVAKIAAKYDVTHATVGRFFKNCLEADYINENYELTQKGHEWLSYYQNMRQGLTTYLMNLGVPKSDIERNVCAMLEQVDNHVISAMLSNMKEQSWNHNSDLFGKGKIEKLDLDSMMENGRYQVDFVLLKHAQDNSSRRKLSMADRGFLKPAWLVNDKTEHYLELEPCEIQAFSKVNGQLMKGRLSSLSYFMNDLHIKADFTEEGKIRIPLKACICHQRENSRLTCMVPIMVVCSVGRVHMPESTALLVFGL